MRGVRSALLPRACSPVFHAADDHPKTGKRSQRPLDAPSDLVLRKTAETCAERRYRYRMEIETTNLPNECIEPRVDVFQSRVAPPVTLGGEVDAARRLSRFESRLPGDARRSRSGRGLRPSSSGGSRLGTATHGGVWCPTFQLSADAVANLRRHPNTSQRFDRLGLPADNELDKGLDVRLLDQIATLGDRDLPGNWFPRFRNPVDGCDRQRSGVSRPGNAPLPPPGRPNQAGNPRHSLPFAEREQVVGEIVVASRSGPRGSLLALSRLALRRQGPCASQLSENPILIPSIGAEQAEKAALSLGKRSGHEAVIQRTPRVAGYRAAIVATSGGGDPDDRLLPTFANAASVVP